MGHASPAVFRIVRVWNAVMTAAAEVAASVNPARRATVERAYQVDRFCMPSGYLVSHTT